MKGGWTLSENKTRPVEDGPLAKVWRGRWGRIKENDKKTMNEKILRASSLKKNFCIDLPKYFTEILAMRTREQIGVKKNFCS